MERPRDQDGRSPGSVSLRGDARPVAGRCTAAALLGAAAALASALAGCVASPERAPFGASTPACTDLDGDGRGPYCAAGPDCDDGDPEVGDDCPVCDAPEAGCPCGEEGATLECGTQHVSPDGYVDCTYGTRYCAGGFWTECLTGSAATISFAPGAKPQGLGPPIACVDNPCNPYCKTMKDTPDGGAISPEAGPLVYPTDAAVDAPPGPLDLARLADGGALPLPGTPYLYHELVPNMTVTDPVKSVQTILPTADVYMLINDGASMREESQALVTALGNASGLVEVLKTAFGVSVEFGMGRYGDYNQWPYSTLSGQKPEPFNHVLGIQGDKIPAKFAAAFIQNAAYGTTTKETLRDSTSWPESLVPALWALATNVGNDKNGLSQGASTWWTPPRNLWKSPFPDAPPADLAPCASGRAGYACFRPKSMPIYLVFTDAPSHNGPGGWYNYAQVPGYQIAGAALFPAPVAKPGGSTFASAPLLDPKVFGVYEGVVAGTSVSRVGGAVHARSLRDCKAPAGLQLGHGALGADAIYKVVVTERTYYHFSLLASPALLGGTFPGSFLYLKRASDAGDVTPVLDCNADASLLGLVHYGYAEINGALDPGDYYLVIDNWAGLAAYKYVLQVGAWDDTSPYAAPSYAQAVSALKKQHARVIGIDTSGVECGQAPQSYSQYETRPFLEKLAIDTKSVNGTTGKPIVVSMRNNATNCAGGGGTNALREEVAKAVNELASTLRRDVHLRAVDASPLPALAMQPPLPGGPAAFVEKVTAKLDAGALAGCKSPHVGSDELGYGYFTQCSLGAAVNFDVTFRVPPSLPPAPMDRYFRFDLVAVADLLTELVRIPVILKIPAAKPGYEPLTFPRDYDATAACPDGTRVSWGTFSWSATTPMASPTQYSRIEFAVATAATSAALFAAPLDPLATAALVPADTQKGSTSVSATLAAAGRPEHEPFLRVLMTLYPSADKLSVVPSLHAWDLTLSCVPNQ